METSTKGATTEGIVSMSTSVINNQGGGAASPVYINRQQNNLMRKNLQHATASIPAANSTGNSFYPGSRALPQQRNYLFKQTSIWD